MKFHTSIFSRMLTRSFLFLGMFAALAIYVSTEARSDPSGITGTTLKTSKLGCSCHGNGASPGTEVTLSTPNTEVEPGKSITVTVTVTNPDEAAGGVDIAVRSGVLAAGPGLRKAGSEVTHSSPKTFDANHTATWTFTYTAPNREGLDSIYATGNAVNRDGRETGDEWNWATNLVLTLKKASSTTPVLSTVSAIDFGTFTQASTDHYKYLVIQNTGTAALSITGATLNLNSDKDFSVVGSTGMTIQPGAKDSILVKFNSANVGDHSTTLSIESNDAASPKIVTLSAHVNAASAAQVEFFPKTVEFGTVKVGSSATAQAKIKNVGTAAAIVDSVKLDGTGFTVVAIEPLAALLLPYTLNAGDSIVGTIQFQPTTAGPATGHVTFILHDGTRIVATVSGNGEAVQSVRSSSASTTALKLSPNPASSFATVTLESAQNTQELTLTDIGGRIVHRELVANSAGQSLRINTSELSPGIYFVRALSEGRMIAETRLVVQR